MSWRLILLAFFASCLFSQLAYGAWVATDNFDGYSTGAALHSLNGGSGWAGAWTKIDGNDEVTIETAPAGGQGGNAIRVQNTNTTNDEIYRRAITGISAGIVRFRARINHTAVNQGPVVSLRDGTQGRMYVKFEIDGNIKLYDFDITSYVTIQAYSADTWYTIDIEFDDSAQPDKYRARVDEGTWSGWKTVDGGSYTTITTLGVASESENSTTLQFWVDDIKPLVTPTRRTTQPIFFQ